MSDASTAPSWFLALDEEDHQFIRRFILHSGSLKALAEEYDVSYPTLRTRLDRLIEKVKAVEDPKARDPLHLKLQLLVADGEISHATAKAILVEYEASKRRRNS
jgi:hypothetical protein